MLKDYKSSFTLLKSFYLHGILVCIGQHEQFFIEYCVLPTVIGSIWLSKLSHQLKENVKDHLY